MATSKPKAPLINFDDMLGIEPKQDTSPAPVQGGIVGMDFNLMEFFLQHLFKLYGDQQLADMVDSVRQFGILLSIILWHTEGGRKVRAKLRAFTGQGSKIYPHSKLNLTLISRVDTEGISFLAPYDFSFVEDIIDN